MRTLAGLLNPQDLVVYGLPVTEFLIQPQKHVPLWRHVLSLNVLKACANAMDERHDLAVRKAVQLDLMQMSLRD